MSKTTSLHIPPISIYQSEYTDLNYRENYKKKKHKTKQKKQQKKTWAEYETMYMSSPRLRTYSYADACCVLYSGDSRFKIQFI